MTTELIDTKQIELHFEKANMAGEQAEKHVKSAVNIAIVAGAALLEAKKLVPHGEWSAYLGKHWNYSQNLAIQYMTLANSQRAVNLTDAKSIREALRIIAAEKTEPESPEVPRESRKPGRVKVSRVDQHDVDDDGEGDDSEIIDDDPTPDPPTIRKTAAGGQKVKEEDKTKTRPVIAEVLPEDSVDSFDRTGRIIDAFVIQCDVGDFIRMKLEKTGGESDACRKTTAKQLRKLADKLDPPTKFVRPDLEEVSAYFAELKAADPDSFFDFYESKGWLVGKVSMKDWRASARKWVRENQANPFGNGNGKGNGNGHSKTTGNGRSRGLTAEDVFSAESLARGSKQH